MCVFSLHLETNNSLIVLVSSVHYDDVIMGTMASQITSLTIVYPTVYSGADQRKHQSSASLAFVRGIHRGSVNSPHKWPVTRKMFPFDDVIMRRVSTLETLAEFWIECTIFIITDSLYQSFQEMYRAKRRYIAREHSGCVPLLFDLIENVKLWRTVSSYMCK